MDEEQLSLAVEQPATTPMPTLPPLAAEQPVPAAPTPEPKTDKQPTTRDSVEQALKDMRGRVRDPLTGKFAPKDAAQAAPEAQPQPLAPAKVERPPNMPKAWGADKAALWQAMTPEQQAYVTDRETQAEMLHQNYGGLKKWHETAIENGTTLPEVLDRMHAVETKLYEDTPSGLIAAMQAIGVDHAGAVRALVGALGKLGVNLNGAQPQGQPQQQRQAQPQGEFRDPRVDRLIEAQNQEKLQKAQETVAKFRTDPANKYFEEVADDIMRGIAFERAQGRQPDLKEIYDRVVWANPSTRQKLLAENAAKQATALTQVKTQELTKARSASGSVAGTLPAAEARKSDTPASLRDAVAQHVRTAMNGRV